MINRLVGFVAGVVVGSALTYFFAKGAGSQTAEADLEKALSAESVHPARSQLSGLGTTTSGESVDPNSPKRRIDYINDLHSAMEMSSKHDRLREFLNLLQKMRVGDGEPMIDVFHRADRRGGQHPYEWDAFLARWGEVDGAAAAAHFAGRKDQKFAQQMFPRVFSGWARNDPDTAVEFINSGGLSDDLADAAIVGLITGVGESSVEDAVALALQNVDKDGSRPVAWRSMAAVAEAAVRQGGIETLMETFDGLPDSVWKKTASDHVWSRLRHSSEAGAARWLKENAETEWANPSHYQQTIQRMARSNSKEAMNWASGLPRELAGDETKRTFQRWQQKEPEAASEWLEGQSDPSLRELLSGGTN